MSKYNVGDKVTIRQWDDMAKEFGLYAYGSIKCKHSFSVPMSKYCGKTLEIVEVYDINSYTLIGNEYVWSDDMFEEAPVKNESNTTIKEYFDKVDEILKSLGRTGHDYCDCSTLTTCDDCKKISGALCLKRSILHNRERSDLVKNIMAYQIPIPKKEILDKEEREYLEAALRPFKEKISAIYVADNVGTPFLKVDMGGDCMVFPNFNKCTMYKGMKREKHYTPEELGLWKEEI